MRKYCTFWDTKYIIPQWDITFQGMNPLSYYIDCGGYTTSSGNIFLNQSLFKSDLDRLLPTTTTTTLTSTEDKVSMLFGDEGLRLYYLLSE